MKLLFFHCSFALPLFLYFLCDESGSPSSPFCFSLFNLLGFLLFVHPLESTKVYSPLCWPKNPRHVFFPFSRRAGAVIFYLPSAPHSVQICCFLFYLQFVLGTSFLQALARPLLPGILLYHLEFVFFVIFAYKPTNSSENWSIYIIIK